MSSIEKFKKPDIVEKVDEERTNIHKVNYIDIISDKPIKIKTSRRKQTISPF